MIQKRQLGSLRLASFLFLSLAILLSSTTAMCQEASHSDKRYYGKYTINDLQELSTDLMQMLNDVVVVDIEGADLNVQQYIQAIQSQCPVHLNFVVMEEARKIKLPSIKLANVSAGAAINAMSVATEGLVTFEYDDSGQIGYVSRQQGYVPANEFSVLNLSGVLAVHNNESFLSAVEIGMEMMGSKNSSIQMKLHEQTKTLFLKGSPEEIYLIEKLVQQLTPRRGAGGAIGGLIGGGSGRGLGSGGNATGGSRGGGAGGGLNGKGGPSSGGGSQKSRAGGRGGN